jgi:hypothetical protein
MVIPVPGTYPLSLNHNVTGRSKASENLAFNRAHMMCYISLMFVLILEDSQNMSYGVQDGMLKASDLLLKVSLSSHTLDSGMTEVTNSC